MMAQSHRPSAAPNTAQMGKPRLREKRRLSQSPGRIWHHPQPEATLPGHACHQSTGPASPLSLPWSGEPLMRALGAPDESAWAGQGRPAGLMEDFQAVASDMLGPRAPCPDLGAAGRLRQACGVADCPGLPVVPSLIFFVPASLPASHIP